MQVKAYRMHIWPKQTKRVMPHSPQQWTSFSRCFRFSSHRDFLTPSQLFTEQHFSRTLLFNGSLPPSLCYLLHPPPLPPLPPSPSSPSDLYCGVNLSEAIFSHQRFLFPTLRLNYVHLLRYSSCGDWSALLSNRPVNNPACCHALAQKESDNYLSKSTGLSQIYLEVVMNRRRQLNVM